MGLSGSFNQLFASVYYCLLVPNDCTVHVLYCTCIVCLVPFIVCYNNYNVSPLVSDSSCHAIVLSVP